MAATKYSSAVVQALIQNSRMPIPLTSKHIRSNRSASGQATQWKISAGLLPPVQLKVVEVESRVHMKP
jgi:hypothetical protein